MTNATIALASGSWPHANGAPANWAAAAWHAGCDRFGTSVLPRLAAATGVVTTLCSSQPVLTFDDGPHPTSTPKLLDVLARHDATATFFVVGERAAAAPARLRQIVDAGHVIGNHSWSHRPPWRLTPREQFREYVRTQRLIEDATGKRCDRVRPPFGMLSRPLAQFATSREAAVWMWRRMPPDYRRGSLRAAIAADLNRSRPGEIVCLHDNAIACARTADLVDEWLTARRSE